MPDIALQLIESLGPLGFIMWLVYRFQNFTIPRIVAENHAAQAQQRNDFKEMFDLQRADFKTIIEREQEVHKDQTDRIIKAIESS